MISAQVALEEGVLLAHVPLQLAKGFKPFIVNWALLTQQIGEFFVRIVVEKVNAIFFLTFQLLSVYYIGQVRPFYTAKISFHFLSRKR